MGEGHFGNNIIMFYKTLLLGTALASVGLTSAQAQILSNQTVSDDEIIVTSTRLNQTARETGTSVSVITQDEIELLGFDFAVDAVASAPGVTINQNGPFGGQAAVRIRGAASEQTLVLIDGVAVNDTASPGGGFDFSRVDTANIERIEILKGAQSTLWGSDAIGGVVSITTKRPEDGISLAAFGELGSYDIFRGGASVGGAGEKGDFRLALSNIQSEGISKADSANGNDERDGYDSTTISGRGGFNFGTARVSGSALYTVADTDFDSFVFGNQGNVGDGDDRAETEEFSGNVSLNLPLLDGRFENLFLLGYSEIDRQSFAGGAPSFGAEGERNIYRYQGTFNLNDQNTFAFGAEREETEVGEDETSIDSLFGLYELKPIQNLTLTAGIRLDDHETFGSETTGRAAIAYDVNEQLTLRGSWGQGFKAPSIFQTTFFCCGATGPNLDLLPEESDGFDIGFDYRSADGRVEFGGSYFDQTVDNLINFAFAIGGYNNIPGAERSGVELYGSYRLVDWLTVAANYAYIGAVDNAGDTLIRVPENSGDVSLRFTPNGPFSGAVLVRYNGEELDGGGTIDDWTRVDLNAAYEFSDNVEIYGRIENVLDTEYQQVLGYGTPGRSGSIGVRLRY
jgi:vitamin B12 transporter